MTPILALPLACLDYDLFQRTEDPGAGQTTTGSTDTAPTADTATQLTEPEPVPDIQVSPETLTFTPDDEVPLDVTVSNIGTGELPSGLGALRVQAASVPPLEW